MNKKMCDEYKVFLLSEDELKVSEKEVLLKHLEECTECRMQYEEYTTLRNNIKHYYTELQPVKIRKHNLPHRINISMFFNKTSAVSAILFILILAVLLINKSDEKNSDGNQHSETTQTNIQYDEYDIFDTYSWNEKMNSMEMNLEQIKKLQSNQ